MVEQLVPSLHYLNPIKCLTEFRAVMERQVDLRHEARSLLRMSRNFAYSASVTFPQPIFCTERLLLETFEEGVPIATFIPHAGHTESVSAQRLQSTLVVQRARSHCGWFSK